MNNITEPEYWHGSLSEANTVANAKLMANELAIAGKSVPEIKQELIETLSLTDIHATAIAQNAVLNNT